MTLVVNSHTWQENPEIRMNRAFPGVFGSTDGAMRPRKEETCSSHLEQT
jgi:hypothetical protein